MLVFNLKAIYLISLGCPSDTNVCGATNNDGGDNNDHSRLSLICKSRVIMGFVWRDNIWSFRLQAHTYLCWS